MVCKIKIRDLSLLISCSMWKKERKTRHFYYINRNKIITHWERKCIKIWRDFLYIIYIYIYIYIFCSLLVHVLISSTDGLYKLLLKGDKCKLSHEHEHYLYFHVHPCSCSCVPFLLSRFFIFLTTLFFFLNTIIFWITKSSFKNPLRPFYTYVVYHHYQETWN
jgi:hypothetical protein